MVSTDLLVLVALFMAGYWVAAYAHARYKLSFSYLFWPGLVAGLLVYGYLSSNRWFGLLASQPDAVTSAYYAFMTTVAAAGILLITGAYWASVGEEVRSSDS
ncbi:MAG: hypothetical protein Q7K33_01455 [Candidatus Berkelbacteria bacterium]|nr:hypothetical protein [Candidatus Berkelbacteria bacterium]